MTCVTLTARACVSQGGLAEIALKFVVKEHTEKNVSTVVHAKTTQPVITLQEYVTVQLLKEKQEHFATKTAYLFSTAVTVLSPATVLMFRVLTVTRCRVLVSVRVEKMEIIVLRIAAGTPLGQTVKNIVPV